MLKNDTVLVCYIFNIHRPILIIFWQYFVHNKVILLSSLQYANNYYFSTSHFCVTQFVNKINAGAASSATAGTTVDQPVTHSDCNNL